ncbi:hypothetical protein AK812_SmicGene47347, partial [Symbiodinium microadriaticum]
MASRTWFDLKTRDSRDADTARGTSKTGRRTRDADTGRCAEYAGHGTEARRERALHALDQITHCLAAQSDPPADLDAAEVVSDSLSEATPGFTPPATPVADQDGEGPRFEELATTLRRISADDEAAAAALD